MRLLSTALAALALLIAACGGSSSSSNGGNNAPGATASATISSVDLTATAIVAQATQNVSTAATSCATGIISETDEAAGNRLKSAIEANGISVTSVNLIVTREQVDCTTANVVNTFASVRLPVGDVANDATIASSAASALRAFTSTELPQPATISLQFEAGTRQRAFSVNFEDAQRFLRDNLSGAELIEAMEG